MKSSHNQQPAPNLTPNSTLLSFDVESNGLHGDGFAVGAVVLQLDGTLIDEFVARCPIPGPVDEWVAKHVLPSMTDIANTHKNARDLRTDFWNWFTKAKSDVTYVMADNAYPVEARFLIDCQQDDIDARYWDHPYPLLELNSLLVQSGTKPLAVRFQLVEDDMQTKGLKHNPRFDAEVSARTAAQVLKTSPRYEDATG